jgi:Tol biopolymer transport system component
VDGGADVGADAVADAPAADATDATDALADSGPACDLTKPFGAPLAIPNINTAGAAEDQGRLSPDELTIYFHSDRADGGVGLGGYDLYTASRTTRQGAFGNAALLANVNTNTGELSPTVTADGLTLAFARSTTLGGGVYQLFMATRSNPAQDFSGVATIGGLNATNESTPFLLADGSELWFESNRNSPTSWDLYVAPKVGMSFANPVPQTELNTASWEGGPVLSTDGLVVYWGTTRPDGNAKGGYDIWTAKRAMKGGAFGSLTNVAELNTSGEEVPTWLSNDGCRLYLESDRNGSRDMFVATRPQ